MNDLARHLEDGQERLTREVHRLEASVRHGARRAARVANGYASDHPWKLAGAGLALGALAAALALVLRQRAR